VVHGVVATAKTNMPIETAKERGNSGDQRMSAEIGPIDQIKRRPNQTLVVKAIGSCPKKWNHNGGDGGTLPQQP